jgi:hypothetical protein
MQLWKQEMGKRTLICDETVEREEQAILHLIPLDQERTQQWTLIQIKQTLRLLSRKLERLSLSLDFRQRT